MKMPRFNSINVIPLIDVMLVLLAIVLTSASFIAKDNLKIQLPETNNTHEYKPSKQKPPLALNITAENKLFIEATEVNLSTIESKLATLDAKHPIVLQVDKEAKFKTFVSLVDLLKKYHQTNLSILTKAN